MNCLCALLCSVQKAGVVQVSGACVVVVVVVHTSFACTTYLFVSLCVSLQIIFVQSRSCFPVVHPAIRDIPNHATFGKKRGIHWVD